MNFKTKNYSQINFYLFHLRHKSTNLKKSARRFQDGVHFHRNQTHLLMFLVDRIAILTTLDSLTITFRLLAIHMRFLALHSNTKITIFPKLSRTVSTNKVPLSARSFKVNLNCNVRIPLLVAQFPEISTNVTTLEFAKTTFNLLIRPNFYGPRKVILKGSH